MSLSMIIALSLQSAATAPVDIAAPNTAKMSLSEVNAFNAKVGKDHPYFIKCRKVEKIGSLVKRGHACRTAAQWQQITDNGNRQARQLVEDGTTRPSGQ